MERRSTLTPFWVTVHRTDPCCQWGRSPFEDHHETRLRDRVVGHHYSTFNSNNLSSPPTRRPITSTNLHQAVAFR
uniref:Uncharacterized protein n=1 Tax=Anguilla anguilla TaxID=7936 RepID=A0A0E9RPC6_ANGAN